MVYGTILENLTEDEEDFLYMLEEEGHSSEDSRHIIMVLRIMVAANGRPFDCHEPEGPLLDFNLN